MSNLFSPIIRLSAFIGKEVRETLRQPRLIVILVFGPFLILLLFGLGYQATQQKLRTIFVVQADNPYRQQIEQRAKQVNPPLIYNGVTTDQAQALAKLAQRQVDLVIVAPPDIEKSVRGGEQAAFILYHNQIDPFQVDYITYLGQLYINALNHQVNVSLAGQIQQQAPEALKSIAAARASNQALLAALRSGDKNAATQSSQAVAQNLNAPALSVIAGAGLLSAALQASISGQPAGDSGATLAALRQNANSMQSAQSSGAGADAQIRAAEQQDRDLANLEAQIRTFGSISPDVLVSPFTAKAQSAGKVQPRMSDYFTPAVIALLLQHLALTFAALSIVREARLGSMELFRVSPLSAIETLVGKYLGYLIIGGVVATILTGLIVYGLGVPMLGTWGSYVVVLAALLFASLGFGFIWSALSETESQAVQYSMMFLLTSVFFSGFFLRLESLWKPIQVISYLLPVTYAMPMLQNIMLRGTLPSLIPLISLFALGVVTMVLAWALLRRRMLTAAQ